MKIKPRLFSTTLFLLAAIPAVVCAETLMDIPAQIRKASELAEQGQYMEARKLYRALVDNEVLTGAEKRQAEKALNEVNIKLLFSSVAMPETEAYTVVKGDSLYKIAKAHGTTVELIKKSNALDKDTIYPGMQLKVLRGKFRIEVDKSENILMLYLNDEPFKTYNVATGKDNSTPIGTFKIVNKLENPTWYKAGAVVPPDSPENILGTRWMGFDLAGYGIHGTTKPESIGHQETSGCVRMFNTDVEELYTMIPQGAEVFIRD